MAQIVRIYTDFLVRFELVPKLELHCLKLRKKLPLLLERVGVRRIKIRKKTLLDPLILT